MQVLKIAGFCLLMGLGFACKKNSDGSEGLESTVNVRLTDNPFNAEEVNVDIRAVQIRYDDNAQPDDDKAWYPIPTNHRIYNLLELQNDVDVLLASGPFPYHHIHEVRLLLGDDNSIKIGGVLYPLTVPSGSSSGFKIKVNRPVEPGPNNILVDFDAGLSIHETGNGKFMLRPVLKLK